MQFFQDTFTGADETSLSSYSAGWTTLTGTLSLFGNRVKQGVTGNSACVRSDAPAPSADYSVSADIYTTTNTGSPSVGILGRMSVNAITGYQIRHVRGNGLTLARFSNGTSTTLDTTAFTLASGQTVNVRLEMIGSSIKVYVDGSPTPTLSATDTTITAAGYVGLRFASAFTNTTYIDNLIGDTAVGGAQIFAYTPAGGLALAGVGAQTLARSLAPAGGLQFSGAATVTSGLGTKVLQVIAAGGIAFSGAAQRIASTTRAAVGGVIFGGMAIVRDSNLVARGVAILRRRTRPRQPVSRR